MNVFEKIKERLKERLKFYENRFAEMSGTDRDVEDWGSIKSYKDAIEIVNQVAEEYKTVCNSNRLNDGWIPVSSGKLPKKGQVVNATILIESQQRRFVTQVMYGGWWLNSDKRMIAWKPLEEPYEGE